MSIAVLVLGVHRSGTSALAGVLARLGVPLGGSLMDGAEDNPSGYFEHREIVAIHDALAHRRGRTWDDPRPAAPELNTEATRAALAAPVHDVLARDFGSAPLWALKDPRMCRLLPVWLDLLEADGVDARCLLVERAPAEVAASLSKRNGFSEEKSAALWLDHVLEVLRGSHGRPRARARFDELMDDCTATLDRCARDLDVSWPRAPATAAEELAEFLRPELRHFRDVTWDPPAGSLAGLADEVWQELGAGEGWPGAAAVDAWHRAYAARFDSVAPLILEHATQIAERAARDRSWMTAQELHRDFEPLLTGVEERIGGVISDLAEEVSAHSRGLVAQGEAISALGEQLEERAQTITELTQRAGELAQRVGELEERSSATLSARLRRLLGRGD